MPSRTTLLLTALLCACGGQGQSQTSDASIGRAPGRLSVTALDDRSSRGGGAGGGEGDDAGVPSTAFDLGDVSATKDFLFLLVNSGGAPVTDIHLTTSAGAWVVAPTTIASLAPQSGIGASMLPVVRVTAIHGLSESRLGAAPLLPMGAQEAALHVAGKTLDAQGAELEVTLDVVLRATARVMDLEVLCDGTPVDLRYAESMLSMDICTTLPMPNFCCNQGFSLHNTGNVPVDVAGEPQGTISCSGLTSLGQLAPGATLAVTFPPGRSNWPIVLDGHGTASNPARFPLGLNGLSAIGLHSAALDEPAGHCCAVLTETCAVDGDCCGGWCCAGKCGTQFCH
ncbi:MAG: hypothetical protein QM765_29875 [Myxococcales bacterium]